MRKYDVYPVNMNGAFVWEVYETESEHVIDILFFEEDAIRVAQFMESGGAFSGWTPSFFLRPVAASKDINLEFNNLATEVGIA